MNGALTLTDYHRIVLYLSATPGGKDISEGRSRVYPVGALLSDLEAARCNLGLRDISLIRVADFAELLGQGPNDRGAAPNLNTALGRACDNLIRLGKLRIHLGA